MGLVTLQWRAWRGGGTLITSSAGALVSANRNSRTGVSPLLALASSGSPQVLVGVEFQSFALSAVHPLTLAIAAQGGDALISWPTNYVGFHLETPDDPAAANCWVAWPEPISVVENRFVVTNTLANARQFFRLKQ